MNLKELDNKVEAAMDWREHYRERPHVFLRDALVGGMPIGAARGPELLHEEALLGVATTPIRDYIGALAPGCRR